MPIQTWKLPTDATTDRRVLLCSFRRGSRHRLLRFLDAAVVLVVLVLSARSSAAQGVFEITVAPTAHGPEIPLDFVGLSFETGSLAYDSPRVHGYLFDSSNGQLLTLLRNMGVRNLRIGGDSVDSASGYMPSKKDIDVLFRFAKAADVNVIYSLRLVQGQPRIDADAANYIWRKYRNRLVCFSIGNEPNLYHGRDPDITDESSYLAKWKRFAGVVSTAVPGASYGGPDNGTAGTSWAQLFSKEQAGRRDTPYVFAHLYLGNRKQDTAPSQMIDHMLSPEWDAVKYQAYYDKVGAVALASGFQFRLTELNSYVADFPGVWGGNNSFATALFALDCMHWWAAHGIHGVNFHTVIGKYNGTIYSDSAGAYRIYPMGYGIKAFSVGAQGRVNAVTIRNQDNLNVTAYAVTNGNGETYVTIINKEHGATGRAATVSVNTQRAHAHAAAMELLAPNNDAGATDGITLGGAAIADNAAWKGVWSPLPANENHTFVTQLPPSSATIVRVSGN